MTASGRGRSFKMEEPRRARRQTIAFTTTRHLIFITIICTIYSTVAQQTTQPAPTGGAHKLDCQPGEQRHFKYESSTRIWGVQVSSSDAQVETRAHLRLSCLEANKRNGTLKYLVEIVDLVASQTGAHRPAGAKLAEEPLRADPVLEEVSEAIAMTANRMKRSVSGWLSKTWVSVKDFFVGIFQGSERSSVSRDQVFKESGLDIAQQCKAGGQSGKIPIDDSIFDDLEPKFYVGASLDQPGAPGAAYDFADSDEGEPADEGVQLSFFDDPKPAGGRQRRRSSRAAQPGDARAGQEAELARLIRLPFVFVQSRSGQIVEFRLSADEADVSIRNFKRHLCDLFATNLDAGRAQLAEVSPIGQHSTRYLLDSSDNSSAIRGALKSAQEEPAGASRASEEPLVQVLALSAARQAGGAGVAAQGQAGPGSVSVLRCMNSTRSVPLSSHNTAGGEVEQVELEVKQVQQISEGRLSGTAGRMSVRLVAAQGAPRARRTRRSSATPASDRIEDIGDLFQVSSSFALRLGAPEGAGEGKRRVRRAAETKEEAERHLEAWRRLERGLELRASSLEAEGADGWTDNQAGRLELLRDQIQMRLNEELLRNRVRRRLSAASRQWTGEGAGEERAEPVTAGSGGEWGLSLSQLVLDTGTSSRRKGSMYATLEEALELELALDEQAGEQALSRLLRDTVRMELLRQHCRASIATADELLRPARQLSRLDLSYPFGAAESEEESAANRRRRREGELGREARRGRQLNQCRRMLHLLLRVNDRRAAELALELIDLSNERLLAAAHQEELGFGRASRYYRSVRELFTQLLATMSRPGDWLLDELLQRLPDYRPQSRASQRPTSTTVRPARSTSAPPEFVYVRVGAQGQPEGARGGPKYNQTLLHQADDANNGDAFGPLWMSVAALASRPSVGARKQLQALERLFQPLHSTSCSLFNTPDLDILESLANFQAPSEELAGRLVRLARRCRAQELYVLACVHALQGQVGVAATQRYLAEQLRSSNVSCLVKGEIVMLLANARLVDELRQTGSPAANNELPPPAPPMGLSLADEALLELLDERRTRRNQERLCLRPLADGYLARLRRAGLSAGSNELAPGGAARSSKRRRVVRSLDQDPFWDAATCKRWLVAPSQGGANSSATNQTAADELLDEQEPRPAGAHPLRSLKLVERELEPPAVAANASGGAPTELRRRHKCAASKRFGPKGAQATVRAELVNDLVGLKDENKFLARFRLEADLLGQHIDVGRMYLWHQRRTTRAHVNILGKSLWDSSHGCADRAPRHLVYMPLFEFTLWLVRLSVGLRLQSEMGFFPNCQPLEQARSLRREPSDELQLLPAINLRASSEASAKLLLARAGLSLASNYAYQADIRVSRQPDSCMSISSSHQPMNVTLSSWLQLFDGDCHFWGSRRRAEPQATRWRLERRAPTVWLADECMSGARNASSPPSARLHASSKAP